MRKTLLAIPLFCAALGYAQHPTLKPAPRLSAAFSKAAIRALLTIERSHDAKLVDAAMMDMSVASSIRAEQSVENQITFFQQLYAINDLTGNHDEDYACITTWLAKLRALSAEIPSAKQCPQLHR